MGGRGDGVQGQPRWRWRRHLTRPHGRYLRLHLGHVVRDRHGRGSKCVWARGRLQSHMELVAVTRLLLLGTENDDGGAGIASVWCAASEALAITRGESTLAWLWFCLLRRG